jgi:hypothetical protein
MTEHVVAISDTEYGADTADRELENAGISSWEEQSIAARMW